MFIVVEHTITNADAFFGLVPRVAEAPSGIKALQFFPSISRDRAVCLWEANSLDALKGFLGKTSLQDLPNRASHDLFEMAGQHVPLPRPTCN